GEDHRHGSRLPPLHDLRYQDAPRRLLLRLRRLRQHQRLQLIVARTSDAIGSQWVDWFPIAAFGSPLRSGAWGRLDVLRVTDALYVEQTVQLGLRVLSGDARLAKACEVVTLLR
ncbi:MAG TPA: hypothetical protein VH419_07785, partial [Nocardioidaceae bacterium]